MGNHERIYAEINLKNLRHNVQVIYNRIGKNGKILAVIKANAYGHGAVSCARVLEEEPSIYGYAVATAEEAMELIEYGVKKDILILSYVFPSYYEELIKAGVILTVFDEVTALQVEEAAHKVKNNARIYLKVDTGMNRIGASAEEALGLCKRIASLEHVVLEGMFTHFAKADEGEICQSLLNPAFDDSQVGDDYTEKQFQTFMKVKSILEENGISLKHVSAANSAAIIEYPATHLDLVRAGIILYGLWPSSEVHQDIIDIKPVLAMKSTVSFVKELPEGCPISYGGTYITKKKTIVATVPVGYADGYPRSLSNKGYVLIRGQKAPIIGRVCMDQMMVDVSHIKGAKRGDVVTLIGTDGDETISMEFFGELADRFNYEAACDIGKRVPRVYVD